VWEKNREELLPDFANSFVALYYQTKKITTAKLTTAGWTDESTIKKVKRVDEEQIGYW